MYINLLNIIYPIGSVYISANATSPSTIVGGTWVQILEKCIRAANNTNTGGADTVTLTVNQMPSHTHHWYGWQWLNSNGSEKCLIPGVEYIGQTGSTGGRHIQMYQPIKISMFGEEQPKRMWF